VIEYDASALSIAQQKMLVLTTSITSMPRALSTAFSSKAEAMGLIELNFRRHRQLQRGCHHVK
jgi:hypothetical protein